MGGTWGTFGGVGAGRHDFTQNKLFCIKKDFTITLLRDIPTKRQLYRSARFYSAAAAAAVEVIMKQT